MRLELLHRLVRIVDQCEPSRFATSVLSSETEAGDLVFVGFVELGELLAELVFGNIGAVGVEDVAFEGRQSAQNGMIVFEGPRQEDLEGEYLHDHLLATEEGIADEFAGAQCYWLLSVCHDCGLSLVRQLIVRLMLCAGL